MLVSNIFGIIAILLTPVMIFKVNLDFAILVSIYISGISYLASLIALLYGTYL